MLERSRHPHAHVPLLYGGASPDPNDVGGVGVQSYEGGGRGAPDEQQSGEETKRRGPIACEHGGPRSQAPCRTKGDGGRGDERERAALGGRFTLWPPTLRLRRIAAAKWVPPGASAAVSVGRRRVSASTT